MVGGASFATGPDHEGEDAMSWATVAQALVHTGKTMELEALEAASAIITLYAGATEDQPEDSITPRDRNWLAMATAFQAAWMAGKPGLIEHRESHRSTTADTVRVDRESDSQIMLAPLASRALRNLSWVGNVTTLMDARHPLKGQILNERADQYHMWKPLGIS